MVLNLDNSKSRSETMYLQNFEMWCWRRMEKISWIDHVRNVEGLHTVKEEKNILPTIKIRKANWNGDIFLRNCLL